MIGTSNSAQNVGNGVMIIKGGELTGRTGQGVYNSSISDTADDRSPTTIIIGGTITGTSYGVYNNGDTATLLIGDNEEAVSTTEPCISSESTYGVYSSSSSSEVSFYGGVIKGTKATPYSVAGTLTLRDGYSIVVEDKIATDGLYWAYLGTQ